MRVLLSIKPEHVRNILSGKKIFEFRRKVFGRKDIKTVVIYCTMPVGRIVGEFEISEIIESTPNDLWAFTSAGSGISKEYFDDYFSNRTKAFAIKIGRVQSYEQPVDPSELFENFTPPQSFMYVDSCKCRESDSRQMELL